MRHVLIAAIAGLALSLALDAAAQPGPTLSDRRVVVGGSAKVEVAPDLVTITGGVETQAATAAEAIAANASAMTSVLQALAKLGIAGGDLQTSQLSLEPVWDETEADGNTAPTVAAYRASNLVTLRLHAVDRLGPAIDTMTTAGANRLYGVSFDLAESRPALDAARERAVVDARSRAELYARAAGVTLGAVLEIRESIGHPGPVMMRAEALAGAAPPVEGGAVSVTAEIEMVFALE